MWELDYKEHQRIDAFELWCWRRLLSPLDCKEIQPLNPKGNQSWIFIGRTDAEAPILWPPDAKNWLIGKDPDAGKDWRQEEKGMTGWDDWMASPTRWTWVWAVSGSWWWTAKPGVLQSMGSQRVRHNWTTELGPICLFLLFFPLAWGDIQKILLSFWYQRVYCLCFLLELWFQVLNLSLSFILSLFFYVEWESSPV